MELTQHLLGYVFYSFIRPSVTAQWCFGTASLPVIYNADSSKAFEGYGIQEQISKVLHGLGVVLLPADSPGSHSAAIL